MPCTDLREEVTYLVRVGQNDSQTPSGRPIRGSIRAEYANQDPKVALQAYIEVVMDLPPGQHVEIECERFIPKREARYERDTISLEELQRLAE